MSDPIIKYPSDDDTFRGLLEPITQTRIWIYAVRYIGGDERTNVLIVECYPDSIIQKIPDLSNMVFLLEGNMDGKPIPVTILENSKWSIYDNGRVYGGIAFTKINNLEFIEALESVNAVKLKEQGIDAIPGATTNEKPPKYIKPSDANIGSDFVL